MEVKQIIVIRKDLKMRKGKMIAQGAHASMKVMLDIINKTEVDGGLELFLKINKESPVYHWLTGSFTKITVGVDSLEELEDLEKSAIANNILVSKITDTGRTEFHGEPTITALAIGPEWSNELDKITGNLKLL